MEIKYDNGTLILKLPPGWQKNEKLFKLLNYSSHWKWDSRISTFRAPAYKFMQLQEEFNSRSLRYEQSITSNFSQLELNSSNLNLRDYQYEAYHQWINHGKRGVVVLPTGAGKTRLSLHAINSMKVNTLILTPTRVLLHQWTEEIQKNLLFHSGALGDGQKNIKPITVATFESAFRFANFIGDKFQLIIVDEAHHFLNGERIEIIEMLCAPFCLSLSATFSYVPKDHFKPISLLGPIVFQLTIDELKGGVLAPFQKILITVKLSLVERKIYEDLMKEFREQLKQHSQENPSLNSKELFQTLGKSIKGQKCLKMLRSAKNIVAHCEEKMIRLEELLLRFGSRKILIFTADTETTLKISKSLLIFPILSGTSKNERELGLKLFSEGKLNTLVTCRVLNEGFDVPSADMAIIIGGTHGEREQIQRVGRVLRSSPGKSALIYELVCSNTLEVKQWRIRNNHE